MTDKFVGWRDKGIAFVKIKDAINGKYRAFSRCLKFVNHSPDGFEWSYEGSGPAQLAFAMVYHATKDEDLTRRVYQKFKAQCIAVLDRESRWEMEVEGVARFARLLAGEIV